MPKVNRVHSTTEGFGFVVAEDNARVLPRILNSRARRTRTLRTKRCKKFGHMPCCERLCLVSPVHVQHAMTLGSPPASHFPRARGL
jgi:hypothetical protein